MALFESLSPGALHSLNRAKKLLMVPALRHRGLQRINRTKHIREESSLRQTKQMASMSRTQMTPQLCSPMRRQAKRCLMLHALSCSAMLLHQTHTAMLCTDQQSHRHR